MGPSGSKQCPIFGNRGRNSISENSAPSLVSVAGIMPQGPDKVKQKGRI
ncbi:unnamed protein product, partial [Staurois parvus]